MLLVSSLRGRMAHSGVPIATEKKTTEIRFQFIILARKDEPTPDCARFNYATSSDGAVVGVRCGVVLMVVTSTGLRSTGGSLSQGFRSVRSCSAFRGPSGPLRGCGPVWSRRPDQLLASCPRTRGLRGCGLVRSRCPDQLLASCPRSCRLPR